MKTNTPNGIWSAQRPPEKKRRLSRSHVGIATAAAVLSAWFMPTLVAWAWDIGAGLGLSGDTIFVDSTETDFISDASSLSCGASSAGQMAILDGGGPLNYCDDTGTPAARFAAYGDNTGAALSGDSATSFFSSGTIANDRIADDLTIAGGTIGTSAITLVQSATPAPTAEGVVEWDTDGNFIAIGDGSGTVYAAKGDSSGNATGLVCTDCVAGSDVADQAISNEHIRLSQTSCTTGLTTDSDGDINGCATPGSGVSPRIPINSETVINLGAGGKKYMSLTGRLCETEASCRTPLEDGEYNNLDCNMSAAQNAAEVLVTFNIDNCAGAGWTFNGSESAIPATANTTDAGSDAAETGGAAKCGNIEIENTGAGAMANPAYLNCSLKQTA